MPETDQNKHRRRSRLTIVAVFAAFLAPILVALFLNSRWTDWQPGELKAYGELLKPAVAVPADAPLRDHWHLATVETGQCGRSCMERLTMLRQQHLASGRHQDRLRVMVITTPRAAPALRQQAASIYPELTVLTDHAGELLPLLSATGAQLFIVDPTGHIIIRYPDGADPTGIRKDLKQLLTWSKQDEGVDDQ